MSVLNAIISSAPAAAARPAVIPRGARVETETPVGDDVSNAEPSAPRAARAEFAAVLALLSGAGPKVRADLVPQMPADGATLIDQLLDGAGAAVTGDATAADNHASDASADANTEAGADAKTDASAALRYGMLQAAPAPANSDDITDLQAYARARDLKGANGLIGMARAARLIAGNGATHTGNDAEDVLTRIASQKGATLEQLLAIGDVRGADARAALDALLAQAGTPEGRLIADSTREAAEANAATQSAAQHAVLATSAHATSATDVTSPVKDLSDVSPELRARVGRVIDRMKKEYGHDVTIVESARSQERQNRLYEQGRTRPGPIVTWTRDSAHTRGEAVDVLVDGSWNNAEGFGRLQRIAREEGLRTLGLQDPGHLELPGNGAAPSRAAAVAARIDTVINHPATARTPAAPAGVAGVAGVAGIAGVAGVAGLAQTADGGSHGNGQPAGSNGGAFSRESRDDTRLRGVAARELNAENLPAFGALHGASISQVGSTGHLRGIAENSGTSPAQRVADVQQLRDNAPAGMISRLSLNVNAPDGHQERITVDLRGTSVDATIDTTAANASRLRMQTAQLQDALGRHGLDSDTVRISAMPRNDIADAVRSTLGERDLMKLAATPQSSAEQNANNPQRERQPRDSEKPDDHRREQAARARDEQQRRHDGQRGRRNPFTGTE